VVARLCPSAGPEIVRQAILGPVLAELLDQRNVLVLHGSAIDVGGRAVVFLGPSGVGKSTIAGAMLGAGHLHISDDLVVVAEGAGGPAIHPAWSQVKLTTKAIAAFSLGHLASSPLGPGDARLSVHPPMSAVAGPIPLARIYSLADGPQVAATEIPQHKAFALLVANTYSQARISLRRARHFAQITDLARQVPLRSLERPRALAEMKKVPRTVAADLGT
jgi:energy-coupling factor transporter ATP-binding protein EcfA2